MAQNKQLWTLESGYDYRDANHHGFSKTNGPITSASRGEVQKHSTVSRGVHTIGSPRVLNDVLTRANKQKH
ncbi:MAG TPA: hypothetical protein VKB35_13870, partial [Ktedonobacteraceae bacterium]|nr:hypothetical protein [Ktedonobacteraceae bacterium]